MPVTSVTIPQRTYTGAGTPSAAQTLNGAAWKQFSATLTMNANARAAWTRQTPDVAGELLIEQDLSDGQGWREFASIKSHAGDGGATGPLPNVDKATDAVDHQARVVVNVYTQDPAGEFRLFGTTYRFGGSVTAGLRLDLTT